MQTYSNQMHAYPQKPFEILQNRVIERINGHKEYDYDEQGNIKRTTYIYDEVEYSHIEYIDKCNQNTLDIQKENTQLWDTLEYLLKQVEAGIPKL